MKLHILGCYSATPRTITNPTSQVLELNNQMFLIDCGEGTQVQLRKHKIKFSRINHVFISHLHGDHFFGLIGLISTFSLLNRQNDLHIYGPKGIKDIILLQIKLSKSYTSYELYFHELESKESEVIFEDDKVSVTTIPLKHRVYTNGYLFQEKPGLRRIDINAAEEKGIEVCYFNKLKQGSDLKAEDGSIIKNETVTFDPLPTQSYAFCSDTLYNEDIISIIKNVDVLYHESTFLEQDVEKCIPTGHSSAKQAATIALKANVKKLILGHYSTRYANIELFKEEAQTIFPSVFLADDGKVFNFN
ncbi:ribonuclease Z [Flavobacterium sp. xlx-214]|uniref:ribonuclease Z n=1 Tax=unclassified Flavobacterium TaxID=196869 RepID=UPI0013D09B7C|nr:MULTISPECIES: ribonuclease Z [unclassified Flavobacterium]MBA5793126.1 ribonuclease Z [Flavobacterium sp. xlx-221]QMI82587.1 ribonuclease Z [Flavobacterium sp. xlx-214]